MRRKMPEPAPRNERYFRCPKCLEVKGPYQMEKETVFCPHCGTLMMPTTKESAQKTPLYS